MKEYRTEQDSLVLLSTPAHNGRKAEPSALRAYFVSVNGWLDWVKFKPGGQGPARNANRFLEVIVYCHLHLSCISGTCIGPRMNQWTSACNSYYRCLTN